MHCNKPNLQITKNSIHSTGSAFNTTWCDYPGALQSYSMKNYEILQSYNMFFGHFCLVRQRACSADTHPRTPQNDTKYGLIFWGMINTGSLWVE